MPTQLKDFIADQQRHFDIYLAHKRTEALLFVETQRVRAVGFISAPTNTKDDRGAQFRALMDAQDREYKAFEGKQTGDIETFAIEQSAALEMFLKANTQQP